MSILPRLFLNLAHFPIKIPKCLLTEEAQNSSKVHTEK